MEDSAGSADAEMSKVEETITYKINALKETWTGFLQELVNRDAVKGVVDGLTSISEGITSLGAVGTTTLVTGLIAGFKLLSKATDSTGEKIFSFGKIIKSFLGTDVLRSTGLEAYANTLKVITQEQAQASLSTVKLSTAEKELVVSKAGLVAASNVQLTDQQKQEAQILAELIVEKEHLGSINELTVAKVEEAVASEDLTSAEANLVKQRYLSVDASAKETTAFGKLASALNLTKLQLGLIVGAVAAVTAAFVAYYNWDKNYVQNLSDEADEIKSSFQQQKEAADDAVDSIESIKSEYMNLAQGVDSYGNNIGLSNDEFERYEELSKQIGDQFPNLIQGYSDTGTVILTCRDDVNELNTALEELQDNAANALTSKELATLLKNISVQLNGRHTLFSDSYGTLEKEDAIKNLEEGIAQYKELLAQLQKDPDSWETLQFDVNDQLAHLREWASQLGMSDENFIFDMDTDENGVNFVSDDVFNRLGVAVSDLATYRAQLNEEEEQIISDYQTCVDKFLSSDENLEGLDDNSVNVFKNYLEKIIDPDYINDVIGDAKGQEAVSRVYEDLQEQIEAFTKNKDFSSALKNLFAVSDSETIEDAKEDIDKYIDILAKYLSEDKNELKAKLGVDWADSLSDRNVKAAEYIFNDSITGGNLEAELSKVQSYTDQFTTEQAQKWLGWANDCDQTFTTAADMIAAYEQSLVTAAESSGFDTKTFSETMASFDDIVEAYDKVKENIQDGKTGEAIASDIEDVEGLREQFEALGDAADYGDWEDFDDLEQTLTSGTATAEEVQAAWNQLATTFVDAKLAAGDYSEEAQALISTQLQAAGVTKESADAFVASKVAMAEANDMVANSGNSISQAVANEVANLGTEQQQSQLTEQALLELYMQKIATGEITLSTQGDIENLEKLITACNASSAALKDVATAKSLAGLVEQYEAKIESNPGSARRYQNFIDKANAKISELTKKSADTYLSEAAANQTIHLNGNSTNSSSSGSGSGSGSGSSSDKDSDKDEDKWLKAYEKAYERLGELRDRDKIDEYEYLQYSRALYEKYFDSLNTSNTEWNNYVKLKKQYESLVEQKEKLAKQNAEASKTSASPEIKEEKENLEKLNAEYAELQKQLEEAKEARKAAYSDDWMGNVNLNDRPTVGGQTMAAAGWDEAGGVDSYSTVFTNTTTVKNPTNGSPWVVQFTPILPDGTVMDEQSCFDYIDSIISDATSAEEVMARDKADKGILFGVFDSYANDQGEVVSIDWDSNLDEAEEYYQEIAELRHEDQADIYDAEGAIVQEQQDVSNQIVAATQNIKDAVGDSAEDTQEAADKTGETVDSLEEKIKAASEKLSEAEKNLSDDTREYLEQLEEAEYNYLNGMKSLYESVFTWISSQLDDQTSELEDAKSKASDALEKQKTAATNALKAEKEAAVANIEAQIDALKDQQDAIQDQIDAYQDEIDAINDANDAREREITLQKALYELDNLNSQRTNLVYSESQGMHYEADLSGIRDARESVQDAKDDIEIAKLEKKIDLLEDEKDALDDLIDDLEDQKDAIEDYYDKLIDESEAYYDNLIDESEAYYDNLIEQLEKQKDAVEELQDKWERAKMVASIRDLTGIDTSQLWDGLKNGSAEAIAQLSSLIDQLGSGYDNIVETMEKDNTHVLSTFESLNGIDLSSTTNYLDETADAFDKLAAVDFDVVKTGVDGIRDAFKSFSKDSDVVDVLGEHLGEAIAKGISDAKDSSEVKDAADSAGTETSKKVGESMTSEEAKSSIKEGAKEAVTEAGNSVKESAENGDAKEATDAAGTAIVKTVSDGMTSESATAALDEKSPEVITAAATSVTSAANGEQNADMLTAGEAIVCAIVNAMNSALDGAAGLAGLNTFVTNFAAKLKEQFATLDLSNTLDFNSLLGFSGKEGTDSTTNPLSTFLEQFTTAIEELNKQIETVDISPVVTQFQNLKTAIVAATTAIGGGSGMTEEMGSEGNAMTGGTGTTGTDSTMQSSSSSTSGGGLTEAMETFGSTADQVLGSGGGEEDSEDAEGGEGVIGKFATLKTKVDAVTSAIGLGEEEGGGGSGGQKSGGDDGEGGTLIDALTAEGKVAFNEENGLPAQNKQWTDLESNIGKCIDAVYRLIKALSKLEEFSLSVQFKGSSNAGGSSAEASGTVGYASGSVYVGGSAYAKGKAGLDRNQRALVGEQGVEMLISGNRWQLVGEHGAEYRDLKAGDIIFSASQTKELMQHGKLRSRGHTVGGNAYADGTPLNSLLNFAGKDLSSSALTAIANQLTGAMIPMESNIEAINRNVADMAASVSNISSVNNTSNVTIGDIHVTGVQDVDGFAKAIKSYLPGKMTQALYS